MPTTMDLICKILKYPLTKLYAFGIFALDAESTRWPGFSRLAVSHLPYISYPHGPKILSLGVQAQSQLHTCRPSFLPTLL
jgi:hypothetical protein